MNIKELAKKAGMNVSLYDFGAGSIVFTMGTEGLARGALERFAALVLEEAAKACDYRHHDWRLDDEPDSPSGPRECAAAIRALKGAKE